MNRPGTDRGQLGVPAGARRAHARDRRPPARAVRRPTTRVEAQRREAASDHARAAAARRSAPNPHWYKDAIIYEARVRSFFDSNGDGYGDFRGLASKLDYLQDLGVTALWLLPFYPSPMRDDGYDIADYTDVHPEVGTLADFELFLDAGARARHPRHHRAGPQPHLRPAPVVQARAPRAARIGRARLLRLERHARALPRGAHHLQGLRAVELGAGTRSRAPTSGTASTRTSPT